MATALRLERVSRSLAGGLGLVVADPIGTLAPGGLWLLLHGALFGVVRYALVAPPSADTLLGLVGCWVALRAIDIPLRTLCLAAGARARHPQGAFPPQAAVHLLVVIGLATLCEVAAVVLFGLALGLPSAVLVAWGWFTPGVVVFGVGLVGAAGVLVLVRATFSHAIALCITGHQHALRALRVGIPLARRDARGAVAIAFVAELAMVLGLVLCGVGTLIAYPLGDLAMLHRSYRLRSDPP